MMKIIFILSISLWGLVAFAAPNATSHEAVPIGSIVTGIKDIWLSEGIDRGKKYPLRGSPGLVIASIQKNGVTWHRIIGSDGTYGWTKRRLKRVALAELSLLESVQLVAKFPMRDDPDFEDKMGQDNEWIPVRPEDWFKISGATEKADFSYSKEYGPISPPAIQTPNIVSTPALKIHNNAVNGWAAISDTTLRWAENNTEKAAITTADKLVQHHYEGMVTAPFLGPVITDLRKFSPQVGSPILQMAAVGEKFEHSSMTTEQWGDPELLILSQDTKKEKPVIVIVYPKGENRIFTLIADDKILTQILVNKYYPQVLDFRRADLDHDGLKEWLLEIYTKYSDGNYRTVWIVDGKSSMQKMRLWQQAIEDNNYEPSGGELPGDWWLDQSDQTTLFWHHEIYKKSTTATPFTYKAGKLHLATRSKQVYAVISNKKNLVGLESFAIHEGKTIRKVQGKIFIEEAEAKNWLNRVGLSAGFSIKPLPVGKINE